MLLGIKTDTRVAEFYLYDASGSLLAEMTWEADRQLARGLLGKLQAFLEEHETSFESLKGLFVFHGPGSFTGLRIGITVMNTLSYSSGLPIVGLGGDDWKTEAVHRLLSGENDQVILPEYGAPVRITTQKK